MEFDLAQYAAVMVAGAIFLILLGCMNRKSKKKDQ